jgi:hypothetical protein
MDIGELARAQAVNRVLMGAGLILAPSLFARNWIGSAATDARARVLSRALGARDLTLGASGLIALREGKLESARRSFAAQAFADAVDLVAILAAGREVPLQTRILGGGMAGGSAAVAAIYARRLPSGGS